MTGELIIVGEIIIATLLLWVITSYLLKKNQGSKI